MVKEIVKDVKVLTQKSTIASIKTDANIIQDLLDTAEAHKDNCAGLAAIQLGYTKRIIIIRDNDKWLVMLNPVIVKTSGTKCESEEGCLSFPNQISKVKRFNQIKVMYTNIQGNSENRIFTNKPKDLRCKAVQHEIDHCNGKTI